jgi:hypothetical protein
MELKNAVAVCLISFFSATLVVLIARSLDTQAAARLEPQLERIAEQLEAIRLQGGISTTSTRSPARGGTENGLIAYYFHGNMRCDTCQSIETQAHDAIRRFFSSELQRGEIQWKILNYEEGPGADLAEKFGVLNPVVVLVRMQDGQISDSRCLEEVWSVVDDKPAFAELIRNEVIQMLALSSAAATNSPSGSVLETPLPTGDSADAPLPGTPADAVLPN